MKQEFELFSDRTCSDVEVLFVTSFSVRSNGTVQKIIYSLQELSSLGPGVRCEILHITLSAIILSSSVNYWDNLFIIIKLALWNVFSCRKYTEVTKNRSSMIRILVWNEYEREFCLWETAQFSIWNHAILRKYTSTNLWVFSRRKFKLP